MFHVGYLHAICGHNVNVVLIFRYLPLSFVVTIIRQALVILNKLLTKLISGLQKNGPGFF